MKSSLERMRSRCSKTSLIGVAAIFSFSSSLQADPSPLPGYSIDERQSLRGDLLTYEKHVRKGSFGNNEVQDQTDPTLSAESPQGVTPSVVHVIKAKLKTPGLRLSVLGQQGQSQTPSDHAKNSRANVLINGSFFDPESRALGLVAQNGRIWSATRDTPGYHVFGCSSGGECDIEAAKGIIKDTLNGTPLEIALSGRPLLVRNGLARQASEDETCQKFCATKHPRSALGLDKEKRTLFLALVEGRRTDAGGLSLADLAGHMQTLGAYVALNLDGGGSSTLVIDGKRQSARPMGEAQEREVVTALGVFMEALARGN